MSFHEDDSAQHIKKGAVHIPESDDVGGRDRGHSHTHTHTKNIIHRAYSIASKESLAKKQTKTAKDPHICKVRSPQLSQLGIVDGEGEVAGPLVPGAKVVADIGETTLEQAHERMRGAAALEAVADHLGAGGDAQASQQCGHSLKWGKGSEM